MYCIGIACANFVGIFSLALMQNYGIDWIKAFMPLSLLVYVKFLCEDWLYQAHLEHKQHENIFKLRRLDDSQGAGSGDQWSVPS